jgi:hypothetical protein
MESMCVKAQANNTSLTIVSCIHYQLGILASMVKHIRFQNGSEWLVFVGGIYIYHLVL